MDKWELAIQRAEEAVRKIAQAEGISVKKVRKHIQVAIISGMTSPDPTVRAKWTEIPRRGEYPTPEEVIAYSFLRARAD